MAAPAASRLSGISFRRGPAAARPRPAMAGPAAVNGRPPAGSNSAASKSPKCASRCSSRRTNSGRIRAAPGNIAADPAASSRWPSRPRSRRSATPPATVSSTAPAASSAAPTGCRTATRSIPATSRRAPIKTKETGLVIRPGDRFVLESGGGGGWGDPHKRDPAAIADDIANGFVRRRDRLRLDPSRLRGRARVVRHAPAAGCQRCERVRAQPCTASASMSAALLPILSRSTRAA